MLSPLKTRMSQSSANSGADQSESRDPDDGQTRNNNPETTATSHATKNKDEPLSAADRLIFSWRTNIEKPGGHHEIAEDDARNDSGLSERCEWTPLHELLQSTEQDHDGSRRLKTLLDQWKDIINVRSPEDEETALHMAVRGSFNKMASQLLTAGAQVDIENANGESPLHLACHYGDQHLVKSLLGADADPNKTAGGVGWSPLNKAIYYKRVDLVDTLLEGGSSLLIKDLDGRTPLMTAIKRCLYDVVQKLLEHLQKDSTELDAINIPDNIGMTPLMQLVTDKSGRSIANIEALLRMNPDINVTDEEGKTALHHVIASTYSIEIKPYMDVALKLVGSMSVKRLLHLDKDGETAFDVTFDKDKKASTPLFQPLLDSLAGRLVQEGESIQEPLCWAAYRLERHWIALDIFQKKFTAEVPQDLRQDQWEIVEWAIYARMPRVLLTYLRTLGLEKRVTKDDKINQSIENGRALIKKLKDEVRQSSTLLAEGKRRKGERGPTSGAGSSEDSQVLGDMEDILDYLYPEKVEKPTRPLELSKPDGRMTSSLNHFHAAIIQSNFVKFRTIQEVLYDDDSMKHIQDIAKKLKQFEYTINVSSEQASQTSDEFQANIKPSAQFTWIHLPSTNMAWMEDTAKKILKEEGCGKDEAERVTSFLRSSWIEVPDRTSTSRFMRPRYVVKKTQNATKKHAEDESGLKDVSERGSIHSQHDEERDMPSSDKDDKDHPGENRRDSFEGFARNPGRELKEEQNRDSHVSRAVQTAIAGRTKAEGSKSFAVSAIYMPYLYFSTYHQSESDDHTARDHMASEEGPSNDEKRVRDEIMIRQELFKAYEDSVIHQPATLDEFYYQFASDADSLRDQNSRNKDQVVTKYLQGRDFGKQRFWPLLRVSQLWVWTIDEKWLITSTSCAANDIRDNLVTDILEHLQKQVRNGSRQSGPTSATEMSRIIVDFCIGTYDKKRKRQNVNQNEDQRLQTGGTTTQDQHQVNTDRVDQRPTKEGEHKEERSIHQIFSDSINEIGRKESRLFSLSYNHQDHAIESETSLNPAHALKMTENLQDGLKKVADQLCHIKDIRDELNILKSIATFQSKVQSTMAGNGANKDLSSDYLSRDIEELDKLAEQTQEAVKTTLTLRESNIASFQAQIANWQASESVRQGDESFQQGKIVLVFTLVTVWFLPLSFLTSLFALDVESFMKAPAWAFYIIFLVPLIFLGLAAVYVWNSKIGGHLENPGTPESSSGEVAKGGASTAPFRDILRTPRKRKETDEEHGSG